MVVVLALLGYEHSLALWICTPIVGIFIGMMYPLGMAWANIYLHMNSVAVVVLLVGASLGGISYTYLVGYLFEKDTNNWNYILCGWCCVYIVTYIVMQFLATYHGRPIHSENSCQREREKAVVVFIEKF